MVYINLWLLQIQTNEKKTHKINLQLHLLTTSTFYFFVEKIPAPETLENHRHCYFPVRLSGLVCHLSPLRYDQNESDRIEDDHNRECLEHDSTTNYRLGKSKRFSLCRSQIYLHNMIGVRFFNFLLFTIETISFAGKWKKILCVNMHRFVFCRLFWFWQTLWFLIANRCGKFNLITNCRKC